MASPLQAVSRVRSTFADRAFGFYLQLASPRVPRGVKVMNPYADARVRQITRSFLDRYFGDDRPRTLVFGINPGRFGAGITGITFTDPVALADFCGIENHLERRRELSSVYIYDFIQRWGGPRAFYRSFFLTALCPLGFTRSGINLNYYDDARLARAVTPFIVRSIEQQIALGCGTRAAVVIGTGTNKRFFEALNERHGFFGKVLSVEHPRFIMQYRRKRVDEYLDRYTEVFRQASG
jgi:hypothetical protein